MFRGRATGNPARPQDAAEIRRALAILADPERGVQLQAAPHWAFATFAGGDLDGATAWAAGQDTAEGVYYALNPVPVTLAQSLRVADVLRAALAAGGHRPRQDERG